MKAEDQNRLSLLPVSLMAAVGAFEGQRAGVLDKAGMKNCGRKARRMVDSKGGFTGVQ